MKGFVYILTNPAMPGLVKVGMTTRSVEGRANELYQTGVPTPFLIGHSVLSPDCAQLEADVHEALVDFRLEAGREFFRCDLIKAIDVLDAALVEQVSCFVSEYLEGHTLCEEPFFVDPGDLSVVCSETEDVHPFEFASAIRFIDPQAIQAAVTERRDRARAWRERREAALVTVQ